MPVFTKEGSVNIKCSKDNTSEGKFVIIKISGTGIGIPDDKLKQIFGDFRQISEEISRQFEILGLGLTFVAKIIDVMNGKIDIGSKINHGTTVKISIPSA